MGVIPAPHSRREAATASGRLTEVTRAGDLPLPPVWRCGSRGSPPNGASESPRHWCRRVPASPRSLPRSPGSVRSGVMTAGGPAPMTAVAAAADPRRQARVKRSSTACTQNRCGGRERPDSRRDAGQLRVHLRKVACRHARRAAASCAGAAAHGSACCGVLAQAVPRESRARQRPGRSSYNPDVHPAARAAATRSRGTARWGYTCRYAARSRGFVDCRRGEVAERLKAAVC